MRSQFEVMRFPSYAFDPSTGVAEFRYELAGPSSTIAFTETVEFPPSSSVPPHFYRVLDLLHVVAGVSYYKVGAPPRIEAPVAVPAEAAALFTAVYTKGLADFDVSAGQWKVVDGYLQQSSLDATGMNVFADKRVANMGVFL